MRTLPICGVIALLLGASIGVFADLGTQPATSTSPATAATSTGPATTTAGVIQWDAAKDHVGKTVTVTGPVVGTHTTNDKSHFVLNVGKDFPDSKRFTVYVTADPAAGDPDAIYKGKTITVTGEVVLFQKVAEIKAAAKNIQVSP